MTGLEMKERNIAVVLYFLVDEKDSNFFLSQHKIFLDLKNIFSQVI